jgi:hypothetical protein
MFRTESLIDTDNRIATAAFAAGTFVLLTAGLFIFFQPATPDSNFSPRDRVQAQAQHNAKSGRISVSTTGAACSQRAWPNYEQSCLVDERGGAEMRTVRMVGVDRL